MNGDQPAHGWSSTSAFHSIILFSKNMFNRNILSCIFLLVLLGGNIKLVAEDWMQILSLAEEKMNTETMSYIQDITLRHQQTTHILFLQKKNFDGTVSRVKETLGKDGKQKNRETLQSSDTIFRTYYSLEGETTMLIHRDRSVGLLRLGGYKIPKFSHTCQDTTGKETVYCNSPCWEVTQHEEIKNRKLTYRITISKETYLILKSDLAQDGILEMREENKKFNFSPTFTETTFSIPSDAKISKASNISEAALMWEEIILKDAHETINVVGKEIKPQTSRWTSFWRKVKRNPSPYIIGAALALAGISFGTAALLKRHEKKQ